MIKNLVIVGSGVMGRGIAYVGATGGFDVILVDVNQAALESARNEIDSIFEKGVRYQKISKEEAASAKSRFSYSSNLKEAAAAADLIIEAVPEKPEIKKA
ncbi:3-hydroxyacyl-CoA dehydrogenase NAD-binding domain-containing protein, partial [Bacillus sp. mrc49]